MASWIKPKSLHKKFVQRLLRVKMPLIACLRGEIEFARATGDLDRGIERAREGVALAERTGRTRGSAYPMLLSYLQTLYQVRGDLAASPEVTRRLVRLDEEMGRTNTVDYLQSSSTEANILIAWGEFSTMTDDPRGDRVPYDFEKRFLNLTRISNLLTTRSDSFTAYILVQGWRNANSSDLNNPPQLVVQRRAAMLIDRAGVTKDNREPRTMLIPVE
jgi:hypothetical protein